MILFGFLPNVVSSAHRPGAGVAGTSAFRQPDVLLTQNQRQLLLLRAQRFRDDVDMETFREKVMDFVRMVCMVLASFFGVRKRANHEADLANVNMVALPFVAVALALVIGLLIFGAVHLIVDGVSSSQGF